MTRASLLRATLTVNPWRFSMDKLGLSTEASESSTLQYSLSARGHGVTCQCNLGSWLMTHVAHGDSDET